MEQSRGVVRTEKLDKNVSGIDEIGNRENSDIPYAVNQKSWNCDF